MGSSFIAPLIAFSPPQGGETSSFSTSLVFKLNGFSSNCSPPRHLIYQRSCGRYQRVVAALDPSVNRLLGDQPVARVVQDGVDHYRKIILVEAQQRPKKVLVVAEVAEDD